MILGVVASPYANNVTRHLTAAAAARDLPVRLIDLPSLRLGLGRDGDMSVADREGVVAVDALAPWLLFGFPAATHALQALARVAYVQNSVVASSLADDKAATAVCLAARGVPQVPTVVCAQDLDAVRAAVGIVGYPVVVKRTHGAQGRWVRRAIDDTSLLVALDQLAVEGPGALVVQPLVAEAHGTHIRVIVTGGEIVAVSRRIAAGDEWRSNIAGGATQVAEELSAAERDATLAAVSALGVRHAGIDLLQTVAGSAVLEVNSCPDFTSMLPLYPNLTEVVLAACLPPPRRSAHP
jgi:ribosomal protein S6--L-glutamate ligase